MAKQEELRAEFAHLLHLYDVHVPAAMIESRETLQAAFDAETLAEIKLRNPRKRNVGEKWRAKAREWYGEGYQELVDKWVGVYNREHQVLYNWEQQLSGDLTELASKIKPILKPDTWSLVGTYSRYTYGHGLGYYADNNAEARAKEIQAMGIPVVVKLAAWKLSPYKHWNDARVNLWAPMGEFDAEIVKRKYCLTMSEHLQSLWANGVNPRVGNPFLPTGLEEKMGVSYMGPDPARQKERPTVDLRALWGEPEVAWECDGVPLFSALDAEFAIKEGKTVNICRWGLWPRTPSVDVKLEIQHWTENKSKLPRTSVIGANHGVLYTAGVYDMLQQAARQVLETPDEYWGLRS